MNRGSRSLGMGVVAGLALAGLAALADAGPILGTDSQICRVSVGPKGVSALGGAAGNLWGMGKRMGWARDQISPRSQSAGELL